MSLSRKMSITFAVLLPLTGFSKQFETTYLVKFSNRMTLSSAGSQLDSNGLKLLRHIKGVNIYVAKISNLPKFAKKGFQSLNQSGDIEFIEPNARVHTFLKPNDEKYGEQVGFDRLETEAAWDITTGTASVTVGVTDSGIDLKHPDLIEQLWKNPGEIPDNGVDDDQNGYKDDVYGWNFIKNNPFPQDANEHGTHVSGIIAAEGNNAEGISGVNWEGSLMSLQFIDKDGSGLLDGAVEGIRYAADNGARVISASWGGPFNSQSVIEAIEYANSKGALFIVAAGNGGTDGKPDNVDKNPVFPAGYQLPGMITVASSYDVGKFSSFSNYGVVSVDLAAPGSGILSTVPGNK